MAILRRVGDLAPSKKDDMAGHELGSTAYATGSPKRIVDTAGRSAGLSNRVRTGVDRSSDGRLPEKNTVYSLVVCSATLSMSVQRRVTFHAIASQSAQYQSVVSRP